MAIDSMEMRYTVPLHQGKIFSVFFNLKRGYGANFESIDGLNCKLEENPPLDSNPSIENQCTLSSNGRVITATRFSFNAESGINNGNFHISQLPLKENSMDDGQLAEEIEISNNSKLQLYKNKHGVIGANSPFFLDGKFHSKGPNSGKYTAHYGSKKKDGSIYLKIPKITIRIRIPEYTKHVLRNCTVKNGRDVNSLIEYQPGYYKDRLTYCFYAH